MVARAHGVAATHGGGQDGAAETLDRRSVSRGCKHAAAKANGVAHSEAARRPMVTPMSMTTDAALGPPPPNRGRLCSRPGARARPPASTASRARALRGAGLAFGGAARLRCINEDFDVQKHPSGRRAPADPRTTPRGAGPANDALSDAPSTPNAGSLPDESYHRRFSSGRPCGTASKLASSRSFRCSSRHRMRSLTAVCSVAQCPLRTGGRIDQEG